MFRISLSYMPYFAFERFFLNRMICNERSRKMEFAVSRLRASKFPQWKIVTCYCIRPNVDSKKNSHMHIAQSIF
jgi:hypothetical protein